MSFLRRQESVNQLIFYIHRLFSQDNYGLQLPVDEIKKSWYGETI